MVGQNGHRKIINIGYAYLALVEGNKMLSLSLENILSEKVKKKKKRIGIDAGAKIFLLKIIIHS